MQPLKKLNVKLKLNKRKKILATLSLLLAVFFLYYQYFFAVQEKKISALRNDIKGKEDMINQLTNQGYGNVPQLNTRIQELDTEIRKFYVKVPNIKNIPGLLVDFYTSAKKNHVTAQTISFGKLEEKDNYGSFPVSLDVLGAKRDVLNFIKEIEGYPRLSRISKIEFEPREGDMILAKVSDKFFVLRDFKADPLDYPFMDGKHRPDLLYNLFKEYKVSGEVDQSGNLVVKDNLKEISSNTGRQASEAGNYKNNGISVNNKNPGVSGSASGNTKGAENANPYPWLNTER